MVADAEKPEPKIKIGKVLARDTLHLTGGLRARIIPTDGHLTIFQSRQEHFIPLMEVRNNHVAAIRALGLDLIGVESENLDKGVLHRYWQTFQHGVPITKAAAVTWRHIAFAAHESGDNETADLATDISFTLHSADVRIRDISRSYGWQNDFAVRTKKTPDRHFSNVELNDDLLPAIHSFLSDAGSVRDYLARYVASRMLKLSNIDSMHGLHSIIKKQGLGNNAVTREVLKICDRADKDGWMARITEFRNVIMHRSPIIRLSEKRWLTTQVKSLANEEVLLVYLGVPRDPINNPRGDFVDALDHFRDLFLLLLEFSALIANESPIKPKMPVIKASDLL